MGNGKMTQGFPPIETWEFYASCKNILGISALTTTYKRSQTEIYRWAANPHFCEDTNRNPIDRIILLMKLLIDAGHDDIAQAAVVLIAKSIGLDVSRPEKTGEPDKDTMDGEMLDDYPVLNAFHEALRNFSDTKQAGELARQAKAEIDETMELYRRINGTRNLKRVS